MESTTTSKESFFSTSTMVRSAFPSLPRSTSPMRSHARCSSTRRSHTAGSIRKSPTNCTHQCYRKKNGRPKAPVSCTCLLRLETMEHVDEEDLHIRAGRRIDRLAALRARQAAPREDCARLVVDRRVAEADRGALGEAIVVAEVPLLRAGGRFYASSLETFRLRVGPADCTLADGNGKGDAPLQGVNVARRGFVDHFLVSRTDVRETEVPAAGHAEALIGLARGGEVLVRIVGRADAQPSTHAAPAHRPRPHLRISHHAGHGLILVGLIRHLDLRAAHDRRLVVDRVGDPAPERMAYAAACFH